MIIKLLSYEITENTFQLFLNIYNLPSKFKNQYLITIVIENNTNYQVDFNVIPF